MYLHWWFLITALFSFASVGSVEVSPLLWMVCKSVLELLPGHRILVVSFPVLYQLIDQSLYQFCLRQIIETSVAALPFCISYVSLQVRFL